jgi:hypothetical protein
MTTATTTNTRTEEFNGWSNRETWVINLWLTNDEATNALAEKLANDAENDRQAGNVLESYFGVVESLEVDGMVADLLNAAMVRVDWAEIARSLRAE